MEEAKTSFAVIQQEIKKGLKGGAPDQVKVGSALLDVSAHLIEGVGSVESVEKLRAKWENQVVEGTRPKEKQDAGPREFQLDVEEITGLREELDSYIFYAPGSCGLVRLYIGISEDKELQIVLTDSGSFEEVKERFSEISG